MDHPETYQLELVKKLSFTRYGGTDEEKRAADILLGEIEEAGGRAETREFTIPACDVSACEVRVTAPFARVLEAVPCPRSGEIDAELELVYLEGESALDFALAGDLTGKCALINALSYDMYKGLAEHHAAAFLLIAADKWYQSEADTDLVPRVIRPKMLENGQIPGFIIRSSTATELVRDGAKRVALVKRETEREAISRDIYAVIPGTEKPEESVILTAHYDSVTVGTGSWDNATGAATLMFLYRRFLRNPPRRTMRFLWCGSEEQGLLGSKAFVKENEDLLPEIKLCFNFDMCGTVLGNNKIFITGGEELKTFARQFCQEAGYPADLIMTVHSSDSAPFADRGIPAFGLSRGTKSGEIHTRHDLLFTLGAPQLYLNGLFAEKFISRLTNAAVIPIERTMPDDMKKKLDEYFQRDKKPIEK